MHPILPRLAKHYGLKLSKRSCEGNALFNGKTLAINGRYGYISDHRLMHEIAHFAVAKKRQKTRPEYDMPSPANSWLGIGFKYSGNVKWGERETQEYMCHFLCALWGKAYGVSPLLAEEPNWHVPDWDWYIAVKIKEADERYNEADKQWQALIRLRARGMLRLPLPV